MRAAILTDRKDALEDFAQGLEMHVEWVESPEVLLEQAATASWLVVVVDGMMPGVLYKTFLMDVLRRNAMLNTVVITDQDEETFHEESEGLGILCPVPASPGRKDGAEVKGLLLRLSGLG